MPKSAIPQFFNLTIPSIYIVNKKRYPQPKPRSTKKDIKSHAFISTREGQATLLDPTTCPSATYLLPLLCFPATLC
ncbi:MAG: hypothetical protein IPN95_13730 [Bacteroidetes bacterium]|nr:hypothetical protein [Bacteroidota bacterium]